MLKFEDKTFTHIHTLSDNKFADNWKVGNKIHFGNEGGDDYNPFHKAILNPYINLDRERNFIKNLFQKMSALQTGQESEEIEKLFLKKGMLYSYFQFTREIILEEVRELLFPEKPSRTNAIWLTDSFYKDRWIEIFSNFNLPFKIFLVKFSGNIHKADARWLTINETPHSFKSYYQNAKGYWNGEILSQNGMPDEEYIGNGFIEIIQEIK